MKRYSKKLLSITDIVVADAFFSTSTFEKGMSELAFYLVSRFRDNACLHYIPKKEKRRGRPRVKGTRLTWQTSTYHVWTYRTFIYFSRFPGSVDF